ncbi:MAG: DUF4159 domain-containing protein [Sedimentisphaerales bacterium]|nr:DUF4159 domain-containing protein [Sedimentisphaerales bacterium]
MNRDHGHINRRQFLKRAGRAIVGVSLTSGCSALIAKQAYPSRYPDDLDRYDFVMPRVRFTHEKREVDRWDVRPGGDANLLREFSSVIRCKVKPIIGALDWQPQWASEGQLNAVVSFDNLEEVTRYPFLFMTGENHYTFKDKQKGNLKEYINRGGFLLMDDCVVGSGGDFFYKSSYALLEEVFGKGSVKRIPHEHEVFHNIYDLGDTGLPSMQRQNRMVFFGTRRPQQVSLPYMHGQNHGARGVFIGERLAVFLSSTDIHCGWCDSHGFEFGRQSYRQAIQMGINIIMYAITH